MLALPAVVSLGAHSQFLSPYIVDGEYVKLGAYSYVVHTNSPVGSCTGSVIAGKWVITAAHCTYIDWWDTPNSHWQTVTLRDLTNIPVEWENVYHHPQYNVLHPDHDPAKSNMVDIALIMADAHINVDEVPFLRIDVVEEEEDITILGFGNNSFPHLYKAKQKALPEWPVYSSGNTEYWTMLNTVFTQKGEIQGGSDSGGPYLDSNGHLVTVNHSQSLLDGEPKYPYESDCLYPALSSCERWNTEDLGSNGVYLKHASDWILETVNGWNYAYRGATNNNIGKAVIEIQSLHLDPVELAMTLRTDGDVSVTGGNCMTSITQPFGICELEINVTGEGRIYLNDAGENGVEYIKINSPVYHPNPDLQGSSEYPLQVNGGCLGVFSVFSLALFSFFRRRIYAH